MNGNHETREWGVEVDSAVGCHLPQAPTVEVGAPYGELGHLPAFLLSAQALGPGLAASAYPKDRGRTKGYGRSRKRKRCVALHRNSRKGLKAQQPEWSCASTLKRFDRKRQ